METRSKISASHDRPHATSAPLGTDLPNFVPALTQNLPILCTILVGIEGLLFVTIGAAKDLPREYIIFFPFILIDSPRMMLPLRDTVMLVSLICLIAYIVAGYLSVLAQMNDMGAAVREGRVDPNAPGYPSVLAKVNEEQGKQIEKARSVFNLGTGIFPLSLICLLSDRLFSTMFDIYALLMIISLVHSFIRHREEMR